MDKKIIQNKIRTLLNIHHRQAFAYHRYTLNLLRIKPTFFIIGTQKAGTTSLFSYLSQHPSITTPIIKELQFFNMNFKRGINYYHSFFPVKINKKKVIAGEATPDYLDHPLAPERLHKYNPNAKLIIILRDPVLRAYSHYNFVKSYNNEIKKSSFIEALNKEQKLINNALNNLYTNPVESAIDISNYGYLYKGEYIVHLRKWFNLFSSEQIMVIDFNQFKNNTKQTLKEICHFLEIDENFSFLTQKKENQTTYQTKLTRDEQKLLTEHFTPYNNELFDFLNKKFDWLTN
jgi:hypothetical protein